MSIKRNRLAHYFNKPYPYYYGNMGKVSVWLLVIFIASFLFSYLFEPFEVNRSEHKLDYFWICIIHSAIPLFLGLIYFSVINLFQNDDQRWTLGKEALHLSILLFLIGLGSFLIRDLIYDKPDNLTLRYLWEELRNTFLVGILLLSFLLPLNLERLFRKYKSAADKLNIHNPQKSTGDTIVTVQTPIESEVFDLRVDDFIYASVDGNYSDIFINTKNGIEQRLVRIPLKELENQFEAFPYIFRSHRSYLVNTRYIESVSGNAQGYLLTLAADTPVVPVSRSRIAAFDRLFSI